MYHYQNINNSQIYQQSSDVKNKVFQFRADIRNRHHEQYFRNVRHNILVEQNRQKLHNIQPYPIQFPTQQPSYSQPTYTQPPINRAHPNYTIKLNNQQQLYPTYPPSSLTPYNQQQTQHKIQTARTLTHLNIHNIQYNNLNQLANLYNILHSSTIQTRLEYSHALINRILEEIQSILFTMKSLYQLGQLTHSSIVTLSNDNHFNEQRGILFMLLILYRELQSQLVQNNTYIIYRWKLMEMVKGCGQFGRKMLSQFGIQCTKAIQY